MRVDDMKVGQSGSRTGRGVLVTFMLAATAALLAAALGASAASADFGVREFDVTFTNEDGSTATQAGSHPFAMTTTLRLNYTELSPITFLADEEAKNLFVEQIEGFVGDPTATPRCSPADFANIIRSISHPSCPNNTAVGVMSANVESPLAYVPTPVYSLEPPPGAAARLGFVVLNVPVVVDVGLKQAPNYRIMASAVNIPQPLKFFGFEITLWGDPSNHAHDPYRGSCLELVVATGAPSYPSSGDCPVDVSSRPFLTLPTNCEAPGETAYEISSWQNPARFLRGSRLAHDDAEPPNPEAFTGCGKLGFSPKIESQPTAGSAETGTGLDFDIDFNQEGLTSTDGLAQSVIEKAVVTLPEGITANPSIGEGLASCSVADLARETISAAPGAGCPNASKIGTVQVDTPLLEEEIDGSVFLASQDDPGTSQAGAENPFDSLLAFYIVLKNEKQGILVKIPAKVEPDPQTGRLTTTVEDVPQVPFSHFNFHFREGARAPLITPPECGTYTTAARLTPTANPGQPLTTTSSFRVTSGIGGGPCPNGAAGFHPSFEAGSTNNNAGSYSPFTMRLTRQDGDQNITRFDSTLPPGVTAKLAGVAKCSDAAIAAAKSKSGRQELAAPSCPASSQIGRILAGAGVGTALTYVPGQLYLAGPFGGDPLSVVAIVPAVAGPIDADTVVTRDAVTLDPNTGEVQVDGAASDPIPHILKGIPLKLRDLRIFVDRDRFTLNPTSCDPSATRISVFGSFLDVFNAVDDRPVALASRYQAANCLNLGFKPKFALRLKGGTKRGSHPALRAVVRPRSSDANFEKAVVTLPHSAFLEQAHIRTICTRVQFAANTCPAGSVYGRARAFTPLLDDPLEGPVYLRSSNNPLPDLVVALHGVVDVNLTGRIDAVNARIRTSFERVPDAPVSKFVLNMRGGKKGLVVNSRNLCAGPNRAKARFAGQNGKTAELSPVVRNSCRRSGKKSNRPLPSKGH